MMSILAYVAAIAILQEWKELSFLESKRWCDRKENGFCSIKVFRCSMGKVVFL